MLQQIVAAWRTRKRYPQPHPSPRDEEQPLRHPADRAATRTAGVRGRRARRAGGGTQGRENSASRSDVALPTTRARRRRAHPRRSRRPSRSPPATPPRPPRRARGLPSAGRRGRRADGYVSACVAACQRGRPTSSGPAANRPRRRARWGSSDRAGRACCSPPRPTSPTCSTTRPASPRPRGRSGCRRRGRWCSTASGLRSRPRALLAGARGARVLQTRVFGRGLPRVVRDDLGPSEELFRARPPRRPRRRPTPLRVAPRFRRWCSCLARRPRVGVDCFPLGRRRPASSPCRAWLSAAAQLSANAPDSSRGRARWPARFNLRGLFSCQFKGTGAGFCWNQPPPAGTVVDPRATPASTSSPWRSATRSASRSTTSPAPRRHPPAPAPPGRRDLRRPQFGTPATPRRDRRRAPHRARRGGRRGAWPAARCSTSPRGTSAAGGFLLVSRVLGKRLPVARRACNARPRRARVARRDGSPGPVAFVGMAETATGLGWGVFRAYQRLTRRDDLVCLPHHAPPGRRARAPSRSKRHSHGPAQVLCAPGDTPAGASGARPARWWWSTTGHHRAHRRGPRRPRRSRRRPLERRVMATLVTSGRDERAARQWSVAVLGRVRVRFTPSGGRPPSPPPGLSPLASGVGARGPGGESGPSLRPRCQRRARPRRRPIPQACKGFTSWGRASSCRPSCWRGRWRARGHVAFVQATTRSPVRVGAAIEATLACEDGLGSEAPFFLQPAGAGAAVVALHEPGAVGQRALTQSHGAMLLEVWDA